MTTRYGVGWGPGFGWGVMMLMPLLWIALPAVIVWAVVRLAQPGSHPHGPVDRGLPRPEAPEEILAYRFAAGEIDGETNTAALDRLAGRRPGSP